MENIESHWYDELHKCIDIIYNNYNISKHVNMNSMALSSKAGYLNNKQRCDAMNRITGPYAKTTYGPLYNGWGDVYGSTLPMPYDKFNDFVVDNLFDRTGRIYYGNFSNGTHYWFLIMVPFVDEKETELDWSQAKSICHAYGVS